jgi:hypothetical protein
MTKLPPDLSRLGDQLSRATEARAAARRRRTERLVQVAATGLATALAAAVLLPGALSPGDRGGELAQAAGRTVYIPNMCDQPRGATFAAARPCATPGATSVVALDRRYARQ